ncbi:hypothetical protein HYFRA_00012920 [Hymenoscyphus fraxineus]|uniref:Methyltransferase domain-containing protein n=1 Tax=Hymenoscyphus fraxineus TaxID=746836 RepID=A0A9N9L6C0_9HELO|nr:hypothetical protein HYFRA_00012920 [Hymenoscyphus fraxineus]
MASPTIPTDLKSRLQASYNAIAPKYNDWTTSHASTKLHYLSLLLSHLDPPNTNKENPPISVLELGCGHGLPVTQKLLETPHINVTANDLSTTQLSLARSNLSTSHPSSIENKRLDLIPGDMLTLSFPPASFNAVVGMYSLIHLPRDEQVVLLAKIATWLKPGGFLLANFAAEESEGSEVQKWLGEEQGWMFWSGWGSEGTVERIRKVGLEVLVREEVVDRDAVGVSFCWVLARRE